MNVMESNKLIAEFMGYVSYGHESLLFGELCWHMPRPYRTVNDQQQDIDQFYSNYLWKQGEKNCWNYLTLNDLDYHKRWDWLMPVVEKIEGMGFQVDIGTYNIVEITYKGETSVVFVNDLNNTKLQAAYSAVVRFIHLVQSTTIANYESK